MSDILNRHEPLGPGFFIFFQNPANFGGIGDEKKPESKPLVLKVEDSEVDAMLDFLAGRKDEFIEKPDTFQQEVKLKGLASFIERMRAAKRKDEIDKEQLREDMQAEVDAYLMENDDELAFLMIVSML